MASRTRSSWPSSTSSPSLTETLTTVPGIGAVRLAPAASVVAGPARSRSGGGGLTRVWPSPFKKIRTCWPSEAKSAVTGSASTTARSEEHTFELQSRQYLVCRLLLEKKKNRRLFFSIYPY